MRKQTKEQAAEARANYHALAAQAVQIAENYLLEHPDTVPGVVYGGATGAVYMYLCKKKVQSTTVSGNLPLVDSTQALCMQIKRGGEWHESKIKRQGNSGNKRRKGKRHERD